MFTRSSLYFRESPVFMQNIRKTQFLTQLFVAFNDKFISYFVYGEYEMLPDGNGESDIDMVICPDDFKRGISILGGVACDLNVKVVSYYYGPNSCFVRLMTPEWGIQFDIISAFYHKDRIYYPTKYLQNNIIIHHDIIKVLDIKVGYFVDFLKELTHIETVKEKYVRGFIDEYKRNLERREQLLVLYGVEFVGVIDNHLNYESMLVALPELRKILLKKLHPWPYSWGRLKRRFYSFIRLFSPPGYIVAVLGTDGSGKSTVINRVTPILNEAFHKGVKCYHLRPHWLPDLGVLSEKRKQEDKPSVSSHPHASKPSGFAGSIVRWGYYLVDYSLGYFLKIWRYRLTKSQVYIFDRYYYDYYIDQRRLCVYLPKWVVRMGEWLVPTPDVILCLGGKPEIIYERKPETSLAEVKRQVDDLKAFCERHRRAVWIDTTQTVELSVKDTMTAIHGCMAKRFEKLSLG